ncbi:MAG: hypothetical protein HWN66_03885 [Candidatus Helarchaeota archaeon]|nr:hypothetical protein [Candidatus Helarchaeota archaeon]
MGGTLSEAKQTTANPTRISGSQYFLIPQPTILLDKDSSKIYANIGLRMDRLYRLR